MNINKVILEFKNRGFEDIECSISGIYLLYRFTTDIVDVCIIVNNASNVYFTGAQLESVCSQVERKFLLNGFEDVKVMFIILSNSTERDKSLVNYEINFWIIDVASKNLIIYEDQPEDYVHVRESIERILTDDSKVKSQYKQEKLPIINILILSINILLFIIMELFGSTEDTIFMLNHGAAYGEYIFNNKEYYRLFTCMFIHFGSYHLINNMLTLLIVGIRVEQLLGKLKFLMIYLISGLGASIISTSYYFLKEEMVISGGASGAIFGIIGSLVILLLRNKKRVTGILGVQFFLLIVIILYNGFISTKIDTIAHLAGLIFGMFITYLLTQKSVND